MVISIFYILSEYGYDDVYGRSLDDEVAVSPNTAGELVASNGNAWLLRCKGLKLSLICTCINSS